MSIPLICAELSQLAYEESYDIVPELERLGLNSFNWVENKYSDTQGFICASDTDAFVTIRGTSNLDDWKTNINCTFTGCKFGEVHKGFRLDALSVYYEVVDLVKKYLSQGLAIHLTGHSQGAAVSKQLAIELLAQGLQVESFWGFGEPRNASKQCAANLEERYPGIFNRVVNNNDIVTRLPTRAAGYQHFGTLYYFY